MFIYLFIERLLQNKLHNTPIIAPFSKKKYSGTFPLPPPPLINAYPMHLGYCPISKSSLNHRPPPSPKKILDTPVRNCLKNKLL